MDFFGIGTPELILILLIFFIFFGPSKLPEIARSVGKIMREFKKASAEMNRNLQEMSEEIKNETEDKKTDGSVSVKESLTLDLKEVADDVSSISKEVNAAVGSFSGGNKESVQAPDARNDSPRPPVEDRGEHVNVT